MYDKMIGAFRPSFFPIFEPKNTRLLEGSTFVAMPDISRTRSALAGTVRSGSRSACGIPENRNFVFAGPLLSKEGVV